MQKIGLVLSGGGAKGAYQVGVVKALSEAGIQIDMISGASIGALNGAIVSSAPSLSSASVRLEKLWRELIASTPIRFNRKLMVVPFLLYVYGMNSRFFSILQSSTYHLNRLGIKRTELNVFDGLLDGSKLQFLLDRYLNPLEIKNGIPMWVSLYESSGGVADLFSVMKAAINLSDTHDSSFLHIQKLTNDQIREALLASSALPLLYASREVNGKKYSDGGLGSWQSETGNTPVQPLINQGCKLIFTSLLSDGAFWEDPRDPSVTVIELRPKKTISRGAGDLLGFDENRILSWMRQGYEETKERLRNVTDRINVVSTLCESERLLSNISDNSLLNDKRLDDAMHKLQSIKLRYTRDH